MTFDSAKFHYLFVLSKQRNVSLCPSTQSTHMIFIYFFNESVSHSHCLFFVQFLAILHLLLFSLRPWKHKPRAFFCVVRSLSRTMPLSSIYSIYSVHDVSIESWSLIKPFPTPTQYWPASRYVVFVVVEIFKFKWYTFDVFRHSEYVNNVAMHQCPTDDLDYAF